MLFTQDDDLLRDAARRQQSEEAFAGVVYAHQGYVTIGHCVDDLALICLASEPEEWTNRVAYLPLK
ncbi:MAG TPA: hypothetical protein VEZ90_18375 [Blastocatellia bacterium]|nr:hypothetical protein [Blastocatellia bacterium]